jgi:hypothetical protein
MSAKRAGSPEGGERHGERNDRKPEATLPASAPPVKVEGQPWTLGEEFLGVPLPLRELRGVSWPAKALVAHLRFRQGLGAEISKGVRKLADDLGMVPNTVCRALAEAAAYGLLRVVNQHAPRGCRRAYDVRNVLAAIGAWVHCPLNDQQSAATVATLLRRKKCRNGCGASVSGTATPDCISPCGASAAPLATRKGFKDNGSKNGRKERTPAPTARRTEKGDGERQEGPDSDDTLVAAVAALFADPTTAAEVPGHVASDLAAKVYNREDLRVWLDAGQRAAFPSHLKRNVPAFAAERRRAAFAEELGKIQTGANMEAPQRHGPPRRAIVVKVDPAAGLLVFQNEVGGERPRTAEELRAKIADCTGSLSGSLAERNLRARLAAVEDGHPDPGARPPERREIEIRTPEALAEWQLTPEAAEVGAPS